MRKIYQTSICFFFFALASLVSFAQTTYNTVQDGPMNVLATWDAVGFPNNPCNNCIININNNVTLNLHYRVTNSTVNIAASKTLDINQFLELNNTTINIANLAVINVNDEVHLYGTSDIKLHGNTTSGGEISAANLGGLNSHGTLDNGQPDGPGVYYINQTFGTAVTNATSFTILLNSQYGYGGNFTRSPFPNPLPGAGLGDFFTFNCGTGSLPACATGVVYGPADLEMGPNPPPGTVPAMILQFTQNTALPVTLTKFSASLNPNKTVDVAWTTSLEINSDYFSVERSIDGVNWTSLSQVKAKGHSSGDVDYSYTDANPLNGYNYYRLQMVDLDSKYKYSKVAQVSLGGRTTPLVVYNNPFRDQIRIKINVATAANLDLTLTDMLGRTFTHQALNAQAGDNFVNISPAGITEGLYILNINGKNFHQTVKLVKQ